MYQHYIDLLNDLGVDFGKVKVVVETGSHRGGGAATFASLFDQVYSIELSQSLYDYCVATHKQDNITFKHGASTDLLKEVVKDIKQDYFLFLDAHGSGGDTTFDESVGRSGSPVLEELEQVRDNTPAIIVIDDLRCFDDPHLSYPSREQMVNSVNSIGEYSSPIVFDYKGKPQWFCFKRI
jgi:hypothetical protein